MEADLNISYFATEEAQIKYFETSVIPNDY
jgi:hypothetical protein